MKELWLPIAGFPDYEVSNKGRVRSLKFVHLHGIPRLLKTNLSKKIPNKQQYVNVSLGIGKGRTQKSVHRLVLIAFVSPPPSKTHQGAHRDGNAVNNWVTNLRWATPVENEADKLLHGTRCQGESHGKAVLTEKQVREIRAVKPYKNWAADLSAKYGVQRAAIYKIRSGYRWSSVK